MLSNENNQRNYYYQDKEDGIASNECLFKKGSKIKNFTFNNGSKLNFLLDTGANTSVINHSALDSISYKKEDGTGTLFGMEGNKIEVCYVTIPLEYKDKVYEDCFQVVDMSQSFNQIKSESGVTLHGVLGSMFFQKYQYVLDFKSLIAYSKKQ